MVPPRHVSRLDDVGKVQLAHPAHFRDAPGRFATGVHAASDHWIVVGHGDDLRISFSVDPLVFFAGGLKP